MTAFYERPDSMVIDDEFEEYHDAPGDYDLEDRHALRRVAGLSTELEDVTEVEYRSLRLEQVVLIGVWAEGGVRGFGPVQPTGVGSSTVGRSEPSTGGSSPS